MASVYGPAGILVYWIVNLVDRQVEVYTRPQSDGYASRRPFTSRATTSPSSWTVKPSARSSLMICFPDILLARGGGRSSCHNAGSVQPLSDPV